MSSFSRMKIRHGLKPVEETSNKRGNNMTEKNTNRAKQTAPLLIMLAGILWGCMGIFVRELNQLGLKSMDIVALRAVFTTLMLGLFLMVNNRKLLVIHVRDLWCFLGTGLCSIVFFNYCYFKAMMMTSLSVAAVLLYTAPAFVMILSYFLFREPFTAKKLTALVMTFAGCVCVTGIAGGGETLSITGLLTGLGAGVGYALYSVFGRFALERGYHSLTISFYTFLFATAGTIFFVDAKRLITVSCGSVTKIGFVLLFAAVSTVIPYITYTIGLKYTDNGRASIIASVEPVVATLLGVLLFHEKMSLMNLIGGILVLGAIVICNNNPSNERE